MSQSEQRPSVSIACPTCDGELSAKLAVADGGLPEGEETLYGKHVRCRGCDEEFELLFYQ